MADALTVAHVAGIPVEELLIAAAPAGGVALLAARALVARLRPGRRRRAHAAATPSPKAPKA